MSISGLHSGSRRIVATETPSPPATLPERVLRAGWRLRPGTRGVEAGTASKPCSRPPPSRRAQPLLRLREEQPARLSVASLVRTRTSTDIAVLIFREAGGPGHHGLAVEFGRRECGGAAGRVAVETRATLQERGPGASSSAFGWRSGSQLSAPSDTRGSPPAGAAYPLLKHFQIGNERDAPTAGTGGATGVLPDRGSWRYRKRSYALGSSDGRMDGRREVCFGAVRARRRAAATMPVMRTRRAWRLSGDGPIDVRRDAGGVPHVRATTEADVLRGLGHCHGVDRGLQLVLTRIIGQGRAAEILGGGEDMVAMDMFFRRIGMASGAEAHVELVSERHRALLDAYVDGINRALDARRPWELRLVRHRPEPWTAADCMLMARMIGFVGLAQSQGEVERWLVQMLTAGVPVAVLDQLFGGRVAGFDESLLAGLCVEEPLVPTTVRWHRAVPAAAGSNNWAVAPSRTATGSAMLANDPHLEINRLPGIWYEAVLAGSDGWFAGASIPGLPAIIAGRNSAVAWGPTYACADVIDSWIEDCRDGCFRREVDGEERWEPFEEREQVIDRRGRAALRVRFHTNLHGTLDGDPQVAGRYLATCWAGRDAGAKSIAATLELPHAQSASEAGELLSRIEWAFNWVIADRGGSLVYRMSGRIPRRRKGASGLLPLAGWRPDDDWQAFTIRRAATAHRPARGIHRDRERGPEPVRNRASDQHARGPLPGGADRRGALLA
jgi:hypothetical protein